MQSLRYQVFVQLEGQWIDVNSRVLSRAQAARLIEALRLLGEEVTVCVL